MYSRKFSKKGAHSKIINDGQAHFGSFYTIPENIDIKGMHEPYAGLPMPSFISNLRIKSRLEYLFLLDSFTGIAFFLDFKIFGLSEVVIWDNNSGKRTAYHSFMPLRRRFVPIKSTKASCTNYQKRRWLKISWNNVKPFDKRTLEFFMQGDDVRPDCTGKIESIQNSPFNTQNLFVSPAPVRQRVTASWISLMEIKGNVNFDSNSKKDKKSKIDFNFKTKAETGLGIMALNRVYYKTRNKFKMAAAFGKINDKKIILRLTESSVDATDSDKYNCNIMNVDGKITAMPPVMMTHPFGSDKKWIIQDTENMIDLSFEPISVNKRKFNIIAYKDEYRTIFGTFEGVLMNSEGEKFTIKALKGIIKTDSIRITI